MSDQSNFFPLDWMTILEASQDLLRELELETLLAKMMRVTIEHTDTQKAYLILNQNGQWVIEASGTITDKGDIETHLFQGWQETPCYLSVTNCQCVVEHNLIAESAMEEVSGNNDRAMLPSAIANYVIRTQKSLVLNDAVRDGEFTHDPYIVQSQPKSVLCLPLLNKDQWVGILYLENHLTTGAFTPERLQLIKLLSSQAAIAIDNAKSYAQLQESERAERLRTEAALHQSEERWQLAIQGNNDGIWDHNLLTNEHFLSPRCLEITGYDYQDISNFEQWLSYVHPDDVSVLTDAVQRHLNRETEYYSCEYRMRCKQGHDKWLLARGQAHWNEQGNPVRMVGSLKDITERKQAEEALQQSEARYLAILEDQTELITRFLPDGTLTFVNEAYCRYFGLKRENLIGKRYEPVVFEQDREQVTQLVNSITIDNPVVMIENQVVVAGEVRWTQWINRAIFNQQGCLVELQSVGRDISDLKRAEQALQESEERYRQIVEIASEGIWVIDPQGNTTFVNPKILQMLGYSAEEMLGKPLFAFMDEQEQSLARVYLEHRRQGLKEQHEFKFRCKDGSQLWTIIATTPIFDRSGQFTGALGMISDITQRKQAEQALRESEERFQEIASTINQLFFVRSLDSGQFLYISPAYEKIWGRTCESLYQNPQSWMESVHPDDRDLVTGSVIQQFQGNSVSREYRIIRPDNSIRWILADISVVRDETGKARRFVGIADDITERKQAEDALRKSEQALAEAQRIAHLGNWSFDILTQEISWSDEAFRIYGLDPSQPEPTYEQLLQQTHPDDRDLFQRNVGLAITQGKPYEHEIRIFLPNGSMRYTLGRGQAVADESGQVIKLLGTVQDISDACRQAMQRKQAEEQLRESEEKFRQLAENIREVFFILSQTGEIIYISPAYEQVWGRRCESLYENPRSWLESVHPEDRQQIALALDRQIRHTTNFDEIYRIVRPDGQLRWIHARSFPVQHHQSYRFVGIAEEITQSKLAQDALQQAKLEAEAANRAKSVFLANMSHELRTPLNAILGFSQLMINSPSLPREHKENLAIINRSGEHLLTLINQILDLSKIEAGRITLNETNFNLHRLLTEVEDMFRLKANHKRLQLLFERTSDVPEYVHADEVKLRQILINLLSNAIKFTQEGGVSVRVRVNSHYSHLNEVQDFGLLGITQNVRYTPLIGESSYEHQTQSAFSSLIIEVEDTGEGIAPEELESLFDAFVQTKTGQQVQEGTGLGLAITYKFVQLMGGTIAVQSKLGHGTLFQFNVKISPVCSADIPVEQPTRRIIALEPNQPRYRILLVDDALDNRQLLIKLLSPLGFELREACNGLEAIDIWQQWQPHVILMDMRMPVMDGYEATKRIKSTIQGQATAIVAVTASSFEQEQSVILSVGCNGFIRKPFRAASIFDALHNHIGVRYVYEESVAASTPVTTKANVLSAEALATLPPELVVRLYQATIELDAEQIQTAIAQIRKVDESLAYTLTSLADNFQYETILNFIEPKINKK
ncbi:MAG TPA: PAS domain S-box protein [Cyanophyceae cyanobacterium]